MLRDGDSDGCVCVKSNDEHMLPTVGVKITTSRKHVIITKYRLKLHTSGVGGILSPVFDNFCSFNKALSHAEVS
jgi:hypothetical protein